MRAAQRLSGLFYPSFIIYWRLSLDPWGRFQYYPEFSKDTIRRAFMMNQAGQSMENSYAIFTTISFWLKLAIFNPTKWIKWSTRLLLTIKQWPIWSVCLILCSDSNPKLRQHCPRQHCIFFLLRALIYTSKYTFKSYILSKYIVKSSHLRGIVTNSLAS